MRLLPYLTLLAWPALADTDSLANAANLGSMTITSVIDPGYRQEETARTIVMGDSANIASRPGIAEALQTELGFGETMAFQSPLVLRGLSGNRLLVLRNGMRQENSYASGYMVHVENAQDIGYIQVEKGLRSVRYGSGAMAGTIDMRSSDFGAENKFDNRIAMGYGSNARELLLYNKILWTTPLWGIRLAARKRSANDYAYAKDSVAENTDFQDKDLSLDAEWRPNARSRFRYSASMHRGGPWGKPRGFTGTWYLIARTPEENTDNHALLYEWLGEGFVRELPLALSVSREQRVHEFLYLNAGTLLPSYRETIKYDYGNWGAQFTPQLQLSPGWLLRTGGEAFYARATSPLYVTDYYEGISFRNRMKEGASSFSLAGLAENDFDLGRGFSMRLSGRYDQTTLYEGEVFDTSRQEGLTTAFASTSGIWGLRGTWGTGRYAGINAARTFRVPQPSEMFGQSISGNGLVYGNSALRSEKGWTIDFDVQERRFWGQLAFTPFFWWLDDMISKELRSGRGITYEYRNVGKARLWGGEFSYSAPAFHFLAVPISTSIGSAMTNGRDMSGSSVPFGKGTPLDDIPPWRLLGTLSSSGKYDGKWQWCSGVQWNYYPGPDNHRADMDFSINAIKLPLRPRLDLAVRNLLDSDYTPLLSLVPAKGRDWRATLSFHI